MVEPLPTTTGAEAEKRPLFLGRGQRKGGDDYLGRLAKYIPAEIVGLYLATAGVVPAGNNDRERCVVLWVIFALSFALVPVYFYFATRDRRRNKKALWPQVILATIAYPVWVFAIGGPFACYGWYKGYLASITLIFVTVVIGFYQPPPERRIVGNDNSAARSGN